MRLGTGCLPGVAQLAKFPSFTHNSGTQPSGDL